MKKILDKYKIAGYKRNSLFYIVQRGNTSEQDYQLRAELASPLANTVSVPQQQRNAQTKELNQVEQSEQLTLFANDVCFIQHTNAEQNV